MDGQQSLFTRLLEILEEDNVLACTGEEYTVQTTLNGRSPKPISNQPIVETALFRRCIEHLPDVLTGKYDALSLLFPNDDGVSASHLYTTSVGACALNSMLAEGLAQILAQLPEGRSLKILEIGAGSGATTNIVLNRCSSSRIEYHFTDISPHFFASAKERLNQHSIHQYAVLDIERDPVKQGFAAEAYDVIIAANVLHATSDLKHSLRNIKTLIKPDGALFLVEGTRAFVGWIVFSE